MNMIQILVLSARSNSFNFDGKRYILTGNAAMGSRLALLLTDTI